MKLGAGIKSGLTSYDIRFDLGWKNQESQEGRKTPSTLLVVGGWWWLVAEMGGDGKWEIGNSGYI